MNRGKHSSATVGTFYRDLIMMVIGILLVGAAVFLLLYLLAGNPDPEAIDTTTPSLATGSTAITVDDGSTTSTSGPTSTSTTTPSTSDTVPLRPPEEVRVVVLNSVGLAGAAGRMTQQLADAGYQTQQADDFEPEQDPSRIWYRDGFAAEANALLEFLPGAVVEALPDAELEEGSDVVLVLGAGYTE
ncbi:MAG TPA: LytR C-terminal domain-containing protein [Acidimicrobiia bacterium]